MFNLIKNSKPLIFIIDIFLSFLFLIEKILFKNKKKKLTDSNDLIKLGWQKISVDFSNILPIKVEKKHEHSPYSTLLIVEKNEINALIKKIFHETSIMNEIEDLTGMKYSIDFFLHWEIRNIPQDFAKKQFFANLWHTDRLFTKNVIKLFILTHDTSEDHGPITWINKVDSDKIKKSNKLLIKESYYEDKKNIFIGSSGKSCLINPNVCLHKAGNPEEGLQRRMLMLQLNPSKNFSYKNDLYERQFVLEPNIPLLKNILRKNILF